MRCKPHSIPYKILTVILALLCLATPPTTARASNSLEEIREREVLVVGTDATYPPFELKVGDGFEGFDIDLGNEIGKELGVKVQFQNINWDGIFAGAAANLESAAKKLDSQSTDWTTAYNKQVSDDKAKADKPK